MNEKVKKDYVCQFKNNILNFLIRSLISLTTGERNLHFIKDKIFQILAELFIKTIAIPAYQIWRINIREREKVREKERQILIPLRLRPFLMI